MQTWEISESPVKLVLPLGENTGCLKKKDFKHTFLSCLAAKNTGVG